MVCMVNCVLVCIKLMMEGVITKRPTIWYCVFINIKKWIVLVSELICLCPPFFDSQELKINFIMVFLKYISIWHLQTAYKYVKLNIKRPFKISQTYRHQQQEVKHIANSNLILKQNICNWSLARLTYVIGA